MVIHLMIAGRLRWAAAGREGRRAGSAWPRSTSRAGTLVLTEAGTKRRASLHLVRGREGWRSSTRGGLEPLEIEARPSSRSGSGWRTTPSSARSPTRASSAASATRTPTRSSTARGSRRCSSPAAWATRRSRACSRRRSTVLTRMDRAPAAGDRRRLSGEGHRVPDRDGRARPLRQALSPLRRPGAAHPLRRQRDQLLPACQTGGRLLADRALSRLLKQDWPRSLEELEERRR